MKKINFLEIHFQSLESFKKEAATALSKQVVSKQPANQIVFDSVASFRSFMTIQKIELLTTIATQKPSSIYVLAKLVARDFAAVLRDCVGLESTGFILLKATDDAKKTKIPRLRFNYRGIAICMPNTPYQIEFGLAA